MPRKWLILVVVAVVATASALYGWRAVHRRPDYNLLLVTLDTTRADRIGCYGFQQAGSPNLDALARRGVRFETAYTPVPLTLPAHASIMTGLNPPEHGMRINGQNRLAESIPTLAETLAQAGYQTGAFIAAAVLDRKYGLDRGFQVYNFDPDSAAAKEDDHEIQRSAAEVVDIASVWLRRQTTQPFFCWVHLYDPHKPYLSHSEEFGDKYQDRPYDAEIAYVDQQVGRLLDELKSRKLDETTLVVVVGDHGEGLDEHREPTHGFMLYNSTLRVPWIMSHPTLCQEGLAVETPVSLVDLCPTVLECLGVAAPPDVSGRSLSPALRGGELSREAIYGETNMPIFHEITWAPLRSVTADGWKYIRTARSELYDLKDDPGETRNLLDIETGQAARMETMFIGLERGMARRDVSRTRLSPAEERVLAGLGYAGSGSPVPDAIKSLSALRDVKDVVEFTDQVDEAIQLTRRGAFQEAETIFRRVVEAVPDYSYALGNLGLCLAGQQRYEEAVELCERALKINPDMRFVQVALAQALVTLKRLPQAVEVLSEALKTDPEDAEVLYILAKIEQEMDRLDDAQRHFETAFRINPQLVEAAVGLGDVAFRQGKRREALGHYEQAVRMDSRSVAAHHGLGVVLAADKQSAESLRHFSIALELDPKHVPTLVAYATLLATHPDAEFRDGKTAVRFASRASGITQNKALAPLDALAAAYAEVGRFEDAVRVAEEAAQLPEATSSGELSAQLQERLALYRAGKPVRIP